MYFLLLFFEELLGLLSLLGTLEFGDSDAYSFCLELGLFGTINEAAEEHFSRKENVVD